VTQKARLAVVSPSLDKRHGTERCVVEWIPHLAEKFEIHVYSQQVDDVDLSKVTWHRIPKLPGPHLFSFLWWFLANHLWRFWDRRFHGLRHDLVFSPGINCFDADAMSVHIVFAEYARKVAPELAPARHSIATWPRILHRRLYYRLIAALERRIYTRPDIALILIARKTAVELERFYRPCPECPVLYVGLDRKIFNPEKRLALREEARRELAIANDRFVVLLVGNDWRNKGVPVLLDALVQLREFPVDLIVVSREDSSALNTQIIDRRLDGRVRVLPPRKDIEFYYSAADVYAGPSLEDTFALPPAEAMACGLPVIVSLSNGTSEIITHGANGLILDDPKDATALAAMIRQLWEDVALRSRLGENAAQTAAQYTWARNGRDLISILEDILRRKSPLAAQTVTQEL
jgi:UDP-glucose:(heptosyl)LPS alpha-1,3-glucosyltransferase